MARVTITEVKEIMETSLTDPKILAFIKSANIIVTDAFLETTVTAAVLKEIEKWFAAHMISVLERPVSQEKVGDAEIIYAGKLGSGLNSTPYGQMVLTIDTTGTMAKLGKKKVVIYAIKQFDDEY